MDAGIHPVLDLGYEVRRGLRSVLCFAKPHGRASSVLAGPKPCRGRTLSAPGQWPPGSPGAFRRAGGGAAVDAGIHPVLDLGYEVRRGLRSVLGEVRYGHGGTAVPLSPVGAARSGASGPVCRVRRAGLHVPAGPAGPVVSGAGWPGSGCPLQPPAAGRRGRPGRDLRPGLVCRP